MRATLEPAPLLLYADELAGGSVDVNFQLGVISAGAVEHVPDQSARRAAPIEQVQHRSIWILLQELVATVFLRLLECLVGIHFEESDLKHQGRGVTLGITVLYPG